MGGAYQPPTKKEKKKKKKKKTKNEKKKKKTERVDKAYWLHPRQFLGNQLTFHGQ